MKRVVCLLLILALLLCVPMATSFVAADDVMYGDVDGSGKINNRDLARLQQYITGWEVTIDAVASDVDANGRINNRDLARLQQYITGWDVQMGPEKPVVPPVELPPVGYDLDGKGRILVESVSLDGNVVTVTLANVCTDRITEESSFVLYTCTDADGNVLTLDENYFGEFYFGMLEVGDRYVGTITLPEGTTKLTFGDWYIKYWSPWDTSLAG